MASASAFVRASKKFPCPICQEIKWCGIKADGSIAICMRVSEGARKESSNGGWVHVLKEGGRSRSGNRAYSIRPIQCRTKWSEFEPGPLRAVDNLASILLLDTGALVDLSAGHHDRKWFFPMFDAQREVIGIRYRAHWSGKVIKFCERGSRLGLFIPNRPLDTSTVHVAEGESDTAALLSMGLFSIGVPGSGQASDLVVDFIRGRSLSVVIVGDNDDAGRSGATRLASRLSLYSPCVKLIYPPAGIKDARAWLHQGGAREDLEQAAREAAPVPLRVVS